jgi:hypothetical protein
LNHWQYYKKNASRRAAFLDLKRPSMLCDNSMRDREAKACSAFLKREERIKNMIQMRLLNP